MKHLKKLFRVSILTVSLCVVTILFIGCSDFVGQESRSGAAQILDFFKVPKNSKGNTCEQQNIIDRLRATTDPTKIMWIHLVSLDGKIIKRMPIRNKVTSSGKRLEPKHAANGVNAYYPNSGFLIPGNTGTNDNHYYRTNEFIGPDGVYGDSDNYIYWFDPMGRYHQWGTAGGLGYLLTDYPIDLTNPMDEITGLYNAHKAAQEWQREQEKQFEITEGAAKKAFEKKMKEAEKQAVEINATTKKEGK